MKRLLLYILTLAVAAGCQDYPYGKKPLVGTADLTFSVTLPPTAKPESRAYNDTDVINIDVLVFDENLKFIERKNVNQIGGTAATKTFSLKLDYTTEPRTFHIIANGRNSSGTDRLNFSDISAGMNESAAIPILKTSATSSIDEAAITPLIMWGRVKLNSVTQSVINVSDAKLLRATAAITVENLTGGNFTVSQMTCTNAPSFGFAAPTDYSNPAAVPSTPTLPQGNVQTATSYYSSIGTNPLLYVYERTNASTDHLAVLLQGVYQSTPYYYKLVLVDDAGNYLNVVRNHRYTIKIKSVNGPGYPTINEAIQNTPANLLTYEILDTREDIFLIVADGLNELGISNNHLELKGKFDNSTIEIAKVYATRTSLSTTTNLNVLINLALSTPDANGLRSLTGKWNSNTYESGTITVTDGVLSQTINVDARELNTNRLTNNGNSNNVLTYQLAGAANTPWCAWIEQSPSNGARLHHQLSAVEFSPTWGYSALESREHSTAYLHVSSSSGNKSIIRYNCLDETGALKVGRIIILPQ